MFKLVLLVAVVWLVLRALSRWRIEVHRVNPPPGQPPGYEPMARCAGCGVHLPVSALSRSGRCGKCQDSAAP